eukprot:CAMPEP_0170531022 /NCGR_PEP_ID=MMETSP0209-20121228/57004_1 /TAXON_ID=665100 ORGANISM="Litonotus pictus, Strain P1" /NCGR_SAMPLE_ID=MMETSP0209 /ASSEMBLY_ACC=CAM_ASM_000301 /LENGTH=137 /DNA_ID=CAMNT_0010825057 /DNA_START=302 /DNA_END=712 /DNA_ORIENTATION=-
MKNFLKSNTRNSFRQMNDYTLQFQQNMASLINLSNLFEQTAILKIENFSSEIIHTINTDINPEVKKQIIQGKLDIINETVAKELDSVLEKITEYESVSERKIDRMRDEMVESMEEYWKPYLKGSSYDSERNKGKSSN